MSDPSKSISNEQPATNNTNSRAGLVKKPILPNQTLVTDLPDKMINRQSSGNLHPIQTHLIRPDSINMTSERTQISINGIDYDIVFLSNKNRPSTLNNNAPLVTEFFIKVILDPLATSIINPTKQLTSTESKLVYLAKMITLALPQEIKQLVIENNISINQLKQLSSRSEGYPLPDAQLIDKKLILSNGIKVNIPPSITLPVIKSEKPSQMTVLPSIHFNNQKWYLSVKPIIREVDIKLSLIGSNKNEGAIVSVEKALTIAKPEIARLYANLIKPLENIPIKQYSSSAGSHSRLEADGSKQTLTNQNSVAKAIHLNTMTQPNIKAENKLETYSSSELTPSVKVTKQALMLAALNKAFGKAGSLPITLHSNKEVKYNLATELNKLIPQINPTNLFSLADPNKIREELIGLLNLNAIHDVKTLVKPLLSHMNSISILFHLLLGTKTSQSNTDQLNNKIKLSKTTLDYFQRLQQKMGASNTLLAMLEKAGTTEAAGKLISNLSLYSQASNDINGQSNWYFTLPYSLNLHQDNLEGHFTQETSDDSDKLASWRLQLKFNLLQGPILIQANVLEASLNMTISVENTELQKRIDKLLPPLVKKLSAIGLTPDKVSTQHSKLPASLLPGEHYLVKIKA
jgi:hypothetical protein